MNESYITFESQIAECLSQFPKLKRGTSSDGKAIVGGDIDIVDSEGKYWETFQIEIHHRDGYPFGFPFLFETGGKIPRIPEWHVYTNTGSCCITVPPEEKRVCKNGIKLTDYIKSFALPYLFNQTHRRVEGFYKNGEYSHGIQGLLEYYDGVLKTNGDVRRTIQIMLRVSNGKRPGRREICFCGSREKFRRCHRDAFDRLTEIGSESVKSDAFEIAKGFGLLPT